MESKFKNQKGITMIALIITVIVLLILAGITIAMIVGDNGIVTRSRDAKKETMLAEANEKVQLAMAAAKLTIEEELLADGSYDPIIAYADTTSSIYKAINDELKVSDGWEVGSISDSGKIEIRYNNSEFIKLNGNEPQVYNITVNSAGVGYYTPREFVIGEPIDYTTTLNGKTLTNWKVFYSEGDYVWLIYGDYLENAAIPTITNLNKTGYRVNSNSRVNLINALSTPSNWSSLLTGTINGNAIDYSSSLDTNIKAMGSPTLELYKNSWNAKYPNTETYKTNQIYTAEMASAQSDGLKGYYVSRTNNPPTTSEYSAQMSGSQGYPNSNGTDADVLYYPHTSLWNRAYGFWLASPSASNPGNVMYVDDEGYVSNSFNSNDGFGCRPVVCLPSSVLN